MELMLDAIYSLRRSTKSTVGLAAGAAGAAVSGAVGGCGAGGGGARPGGGLITSYFTGGGNKTAEGTRPIGAFFGGSAKAPLPPCPAVRGGGRVGGRGGARGGARVGGRGGGSSMWRERDVLPFSKSVPGAPSFCVDAFTGGLEFLTSLPDLSTHLCFMPRGLAIFS